MLFVLEATVTVARLPVVHKDFRVLCFIAERPGESAVIFVGVREYDATQIRNEKTGFAQSRTQRLDRFFRLWSSVDDRQRIFSDHVDVYWTDVERRGQRYRNNPHLSASI